MLKIITNKYIILSVMTFVISISAILILSAFSSQQNATFTHISNPEENFPYISPTPGEIPIIGWNPCINNKYPSIEEYLRFKECGFNAGIVHCSMNNIETVSDIAASAHIPLILGRGYLSSRNNIRYVERYDSIKNIAAWFFVDEPEYKHWNELKDAYDRLVSTGTSKMIYINLGGCYLKNTINPYQDYINYLNKMEMLFKPAVWSFDSYPIKVSDGLTVVTNNLFYTSLEFTSKISKITHRPFWSFCQSMGYRNKSIERPNATIPYLKFANFTALAYGAQGILYWTYTQEKSTENTTYLSALVNLDGKRTDAWYAAQRVNQEIHLFTDVFLNCEVKEVRHVGKEFIPNTQQLEGSIGPIEKIQSGDSGVIISCLNNNGKHYIVIVSRDPFQKQNIGINFSREYDVRLLSPTDTPSGLKIKEQKLKNKIKDTLSPGGYLIFEYAKALPDKGEF